MKKFKGLILLSALLSIEVFSQDKIVFKESNGLVAVEAEHFSSQSKNSVRAWYLFSESDDPDITPDHDNNHSETASNRGYIEVLPDTRVTHDDPLQNGINFSNTAGQMGIVSYYVDFETTGKYYVWARIYSTGTEDNGIHVGIDDTWPSSGNRMQWCEGKNQWTWNSKQRTSANHCGEPYLIYLNVNTTGIHKISFSMREDGVELDKWLMTTNRDYIPMNAGPDQVLISGGDSTAPSMPGNFSAELVKENFILLEWEPSVDNESQILNYYLYRNGFKIATLADTATKYYEPDLEYDTAYEYELKSKNKWSLYSESAVININTIPDQTPPKVEGLFPTAEGNLYLVFSEKLEENSAKNISNYSLSNNAEIVGIELREYNQAVLLEVNGHQADENYTLTITNISDENGVKISEDQMGYTYYKSLYYSISEAEFLRGAGKTAAPGSLYFLSGICPTDSSEIKFNIDLPHGGDWYLWGRLFASGGGNDPNVFNLTVDYGEQKKLGNNSDYFNLWHWGGDGTLSSGEISALHLGNLTEGEHSISLTAAEPVINPGSRRFFIDGIYISTQGEFSPADGSIVLTDIEEVNNLRPSNMDFGLKAYPNPFNPSVNIEFVNAGKTISVEIYNLLGERVASWNEISGKRLIWNAQNFSSGVFIVKAESKNQIITRKILLVK